MRRRWGIGGAAGFVVVALVVAVRLMIVAGVAAGPSLVTSPRVAPPPRPIPVLAHVPGYDASTPPSVGWWQAYVNVTFSEGFSAGPKVRRWGIGQECERTRCVFKLTRLVPGDTADVATLRRVRGGWRADYNTSAWCGQRDGRWLRWPLQMHVVLRFSRDQRQFIGTESEFASSDECGYGSATREWRGVQAPQPADDMPAGLLAS